MSEAKNEYRNLARRVFGDKSGYFANGKFKAANLEQAIKTTIEKNLGEGHGEDKMLDKKATCKAFVCATQAQNIGAPAGPRRFRTYAVPRNRTYDCTIWEAGRATSAAPTFFERIEIGPEGAKQEFVDAGVGCNNPIKEVIKEAGLIWSLKRKVACIVSIGTGQAKVIRYEKRSKIETKLPIKLAESLVALATDSGQAAEEMEERYQGNDRAYQRLNVDRGLQDIDVEEWEKLGKVEGYTEDYVAQAAVSGKIDEIVTALIVASSESTPQVDSEMAPTAATANSSGHVPQVGNAMAPAISSS